MHETPQEFIVQVQKNLIKMPVWYIPNFGLSNCTLARNLPD